MNTSVKTPAQALGYKVGDVFEVTSGESTFSLGSIVRLSRDDGTNGPLFDLVKGECDFNIGTNGNKGAYLNLDYVRLLTAPKRTFNPSQSDVRYHYWNIYSYTGTTHITVAYQRTENDVRYGYAVCREGDQFIKKVGRELALERLNDKPLVLTKEYLWDKAVNFQNVFTRRFTDLIQEKGDYTTFDFSHHIVTHSITRHIGANDSLVSRLLDNGWVD